MKRRLLMSATEESSCNDSPLVDLRLPAPSALIITEISSSSYSSSSEEFSEPNDIGNIQEHSRDNNLHQVTKKKTAPCSRTPRTNNPVFFHFPTFRDCKKCRVERGFDLPLRKQMLTKGIFFRFVR